MLKISEKPVALLALFPSLDAVSIGGVQTSGRIAWSGLSRDLMARGEGAQLICYGYVSDFISQTLARIQALWDVITWRRSTTQLLVWHIDLLRLVPFLKPAPAKITLFLHGIEAWRTPSVSLKTRLNTVDLFLANSLHTWNLFVQYHPWLANARHQIVPLGLDSPVESITPRPILTPVALMLGRFARSENYKGHRQLIEAWPEIVKRVPGAQLWIAGTGDLRLELEALTAARQLGQFVKFLGQVPDSEKPNLIGQARCLAMPSRAEGFGLVYLEAMRLSRPCLVSTLDAGREVVNPPEAGLAVNPESEAEIVEAMTRLLTMSEEWQQWSLRAKARYEAQFTAAQFQKQLLAALFP